MNPEGILAMSRKENKHRDIAELEIIRQASSIAYKVGLLLCCFVSVLQIILTSEINMSSWVIYFGALGTLFLVKFVKLSKKHELAWTMLYYACGIGFLVVYLLKLVGTI